nr:glycerol acyltransferase [Solirubrobacterales bacterium]
VLAYPGGEQEVHRPSWRGSRVELGGRLGFARLALERAVPVLPVAAFGGQETALFLGPGTWLAGPLGLHRLLGSRVAPLSVTIPWGVTIGDPLGHLPLPAKIAIEVLPAIVPGTSEWPERPEQLYELVERRLSRAVARLADDRRLPLLG